MEELSKALSSTTVSLAEADDQREKLKEEAVQVRKQTNIKTEKKGLAQIKAKRSLRSKGSSKGKRNRVILFRIRAARKMEREHFKPREK